MGIIFKGSPEPTLGVEIELQTVDPRTHALVSGAPALLDCFPGEIHIKRELMQCCLEVSTVICRGVEEVEQDLRERLARVIRKADELGLGLMVAGTHPFSQWHDQDVTADARYHFQLERTQWTARRMLTFGLHVHVGISSPEKAIVVSNAMTSFLPHLLALSASSPFWEGMDTGLDSARSKVFESLPGGGLPYRMRNWAEFQRMIRILQEIGTVSSIQELWGDIRPHSRYGTLEVRVCDAMPSLRELLAVTALVQCLMVHLGDRYDLGRFLPPPQRYWVLQENKWRAVRYGINCRMVVDESGRQQHFHNVMEELLEELAPVAEQLGCLRYLQPIEEMLEMGGSASRQRHIFHQTNSLEAVVVSLENELRQGVGLPAIAPSPASVAHEPHRESVRPRSLYRKKAPPWREF